MDNTFSSEGQNLSTNPSFDSHSLSTQGSPAAGLTPPPSPIPPVNPAPAQPPQKSKRGLFINSSSYNELSDAYAINLFSYYYAVDKSDGRVYTIPVRTEPEVINIDYIKSFPITEEEMNSLIRGAE